MAARLSRRPVALNLNVALRPGPTQVLLGSGIAFLLALSFCTVVWLRLESLFKAFPILAILFVFTMVMGPTFLFMSVRRMTEVGTRKRLVCSALLSITAISLIVLTFVLSLRHLASG